MEEFLKNYIDGVKPNMDFASKETYVNSFDSLTSFIITIGGTLSMIIGITGIANFINSVLTSILTRKKEFAMLQSIGMTGKQLKRMLSFERLYYAVGAAFPMVERTLLPACRKSAPKLFLSKCQKYIRFCWERLAAKR